MKEYAYAIIESPSDIAHTSDASQVVLYDANDNVVERIEVIGNEFNLIDHGLAKLGYRKNEKFEINTK